MYFGLSDHRVRCLCLQNVTMSEKPRLKYVHYERHSVGMYLNMMSLWGLFFLLPLIYTLVPRRGSHIPAQSVL